MRGTLSPPVGAPLEAPQPQRPWPGFLTPSPVTFAPVSSPQTFALQAERFADNLLPWLVCFLWDFRFGLNWNVQLSSLKTLTAGRDVWSTLLLLSGGKNPQAYIQIPLSSGVCSVGLIYRRLEALTNRSSVWGALI